ncbi:hypothetical protein M9435_000243 [Picochlorum sp. BPE23]|nr:hypothetical protein M9435_000243 [Picochlorum sp. BPE23]
MKRPHASESDTNTVDNNSDVSSSGVKEAKKKKKKVLVPPTPVTVGVLAADASIWDNAVLLIDKPKTWTSFDVCGKLRGELARALNVKPKKIKVGHAGTLDPMATGLLIVCVGKGTKSIDSFVSMTKEYSGVFRLGQVTDSYDADGSLLKEDSSWQSITNEELYKSRDEHFLGDIEQVPPMFSAIRVDGKRLYESARQGKEVDRKSRKVHVQTFDLTRHDETSPFVAFWVTCSKGTYVRSLAHDLGQLVGCGAHLTELRRECIGEYSVKDAWDMETLIEAVRDQKARLNPDQS